MKRDTPSSRESSILMQVKTRMHGVTSCSAHTGAPAPARATFKPNERRSVLFPDMLDPVTRRKVPAGPRETSFRTQVSGGSSG
jgi:hypothetical protein